MPRRTIKPKEKAAKEERKARLLRLSCVKLIGCIRCITSFQGERVSCTSSAQQLARPFGAEVVFTIKI